jgi:coenzyme F420-0:L-glutamate ligase/coenzyme F420-1:gamma-L-glutamate ligase
LSYHALGQIPMVQSGDDLAALIVTALHAGGETLRAGDIIAVAQKVVSKAEGRLVRLAQVQPSDEAQALALKVDKDPRVVELILSESVDVVRAINGVLITENRYGLVMANAGLDMSNVDHDSNGDVALLLPLDPDASAARLRAALEPHAGGRIGVIICDSVGRAWREATVGLAIGASGFPARLDLRGDHDLYGRELMVSEVALADSLAAAATLLMGERDEGRPVVRIRGYQLEGTPEGQAKDVVRPRDRDLFR